ncbi:MAG: hypothetical protein JXQ99_16940 [Hyphomicrobiaceae bacterium]
MTKRGLGILSWKGYDSLQLVMQGLHDNRILDHFDEHFVFFPEIDDEARLIAEKFQFQYSGSERNLGIFGGFRAMAQAMRSDTVLLLENDLHALTSPEDSERQLHISFDLIEQQTAQVVCLRHTRVPGDFDAVRRKFQRYFPPADSPMLDRLKGRVRQAIRPRKWKRLIGHAPLVLDRPEDHFAEITRDAETGFWMMPTAHRNWTNLAVMVDRRFYVEELMEQVARTNSRRRVNGFKNIEIELNSAWWRNQPWTVAIAPGIFSHHRTGSRGY